MARRRPFVGGNWKMHGVRASATKLASAVAQSMARESAVDVCVFPPFVHLDVTAQGVRGSDIMLGAQDVYHEREGAFTGEVSCAMLLDAGATCVLTGHSERRHVLGESDELVNAKTRAALEAGMTCVLCVGETLEQRDTGQTDSVNESQLRAGLAGTTARLAARLVIAYEPVWAIGTGRTASPQDAQAAHARIRAVLEDVYDAATAAATRVIYGGSVKASNAAELFACPDVDGGLVGGASLDAEAFAAICRAAVATLDAPEGSIA
jgi:triosephosphate isomerase (TIM)